MASIWKQYIETKKTKPLESGVHKKDIVVVGGGIAGITCAYMLERDGHKVTLIDSGKLMSGVTSNTTAHVNALQAKYIDIPTNSKRRKYFMAQQEAIDGIEKIIKTNKIDCDWQRLNGYVFGAGKDLKDLKKEYKLLKKMGASDLEYLTNKTFDFGTFDAIRLGRQAVFNPIKYLQGILSSSNFEIIEDCRIKKVRLMSKKLKADRGRIFKYNKVIFATGFPIVNIRGLYAFKMYKSFSYGINVASEKKLNANFNSIAGDGLTYRDCENGIIVGGLDHRTGRIKCDDHYKMLEQYGKNFGTQITNRWAANDCMTFDGVPYAGRMFCLCHRNSVYMISGFGKWGMTNSFVSANIISDIVSKRKNKYKCLYKPTRILNVLTWGKFFVNMMCDVGGLVAGLFSSRKKRCPHMGCRLKYNPNTKTWDCPCHGSRLTTEGEIIVSPAVDANKVLGREKKTK